MPAIIITLILFIAYVSNIVFLFAQFSEPITTHFIVALVGVPIFPLGIINGIYVLF